MPNLLSVGRQQRRYREPIGTVFVLLACNLPTKLLLAATTYLVANRNDDILSIMDKPSNGSESKQARLCEAGTPLILPTD